MAEMAEMLQSLTGVLQSLTVQQTPHTPKVKLQKFKGPPRVVCLRFLFYNSVEFYLIEVIEDPI